MSASEVRKGLDAHKVELEQGEASPTYDSTAAVHRWDPSIIQFRPISGLLALGLTAACMFASLGVLIASNNQPLDSWSVQPTVPLAILSAVGVAALRYAKGCAM